MTSEPGPKPNMLPHGRGKMRQGRGKMSYEVGWTWRSAPASLGASCHEVLAPALRRGFFVGLASLLRPAALLARADEVIE